MKLPPIPEPGLVLCYSYLWKDEHEAARVEGRKDRPAVEVLARRSVGASTLVYVAPVTHDERHRPGEAVEIPVVVKRHLGLDDRASFIVSDRSERSRRSLGHGEALDVDGRATAARVERFGGSIRPIDPACVPRHITTTRVPTRTRWYRSITSSFIIRMQPDDMARPMEPGSLVPWMR